MTTATRFVFLMHPKEFKEEKAGTGRLTHLALADSEIHMGVAFDQNPAVQAILTDPALYPVLLYPGSGAKNLTEGEFQAPELAGRRLTVLLLDGTWACAKKMLKLSPCLQRLPRVMFTPRQPSRFVIKLQPHEFCLSTLEATHELLLALEHSGLDRYPDKQQLLDVFTAMQEFQIACALDPERSGYRRQTYKDPVVRRRLAEGQGRRRNLFFTNT